MKHLLVCFYLVHAFLSVCLVAGEDDFQTLELTDRLQGATLKYRINEKDPAADGADTVTISYTTPAIAWAGICLLYTSPSPRDRTRSRMPSSA